MKDKKVLILGASGLLGTCWCEYLVSRDHPVIAGLNNRTPNSLSPNVSYVKFEQKDYSIDGLKSKLSELEPRYVINAIGLTSVEQCEKDLDAAKYINTVIPINIASACKELDIPFVHISTDHLFSGKKSLVTEEEPLQPMNNYAKTKALAEDGVIEVNPHALIIRTNFYGWGPAYKPSFAEFILYNLEQSKSVNLFRNVYYTPIISDKLIQAVHLLLDCKKFGIFNIVGDQRLSKYEFGLKLAQVFDLDPELIKPVDIQSIPNLVQRPLDMSLSNAKLRSLLGISVGDSEQQLKCFKQTRSDIHTIREVST